MGLFDGLFGSGQSKAVSGTQSKYAKLFGGAYDDYKTLHSMFGPGETSAFGSALSAINAPVERQEGAFAAKANANAATQANQTAAFLKSQGFGDGLAGGAGQAAFQNAARQSNAYDADLEGPEGQQRRLMAFLQALQGIQGSYLQPLQQFSQGVYQGQQPQDDGGLGAILGLAGSFASPYLSALGGRKGSGK